jgi:hypothetical protein
MRGRGSKQERKGKAKGSGVFFRPRDVAAGPERLDGGRKRHPTPASLALIAFGKKQPHEVDAAAAKCHSDTTDLTALTA